MPILIAQQPKEYSLSQNDIWLRLQAIGYTGLENYRVLLKIEVEHTWDADDWTEILTLEDCPDNAGYCNFNLQAILHAELIERTGLQIPPPEQATPYLADNRRRYRFSYTERYGNPSSEQPYVVYPFLKVVMLGGIDCADSPDYDFFDELSPTNNLATWYPDGKNVRPDQTVFFKWLYHSTVPKNVSMKVVAYDEDYNTYTATVYAATAVLGRQTIVFPVGYNALDLDQAGFAVRKYEVSLCDDLDGSAFTPTRTYYVDCSPRECEVELLYLNGFFLPETIRLTGYKSKSLAVSREVSVRTKSYDYDRQTRQTFQWQSDWTNPLTFRTGYVSEKEVDALQELLIHNRVYELTAQGYYPLLITDNQYDIHECFQFLHALEFKARRALNACNYSILPPYEPCCCEDGLTFDAGTLAFGGAFLTFSASGPTGQGLPPADF